MKKARLGGARRHLLHLGDFGEGQPLDEEQLRGEPLVPRQRGESLANGQRVARRSGKRGLVLAFSPSRAVRLRLSDPVGAAPAQDAKGPGREA